jgi:hypothetical protein
LLRLWNERPRILPDATRRHLKAGLRENLMATRSLVDAAIVREEERRRRRARRPAAPVEDRPANEVAS